MTREQFISRWRHRIAGGFLYGYDAATRLGPREQAERVWTIPAEVERLLGQIFDDLQPKPAQAPNGQPAQPTKERT